MKIKDIEVFNESGIAEYGNSKYEPHSGNEYFTGDITVYFTLQDGVRESKKKIKLNEILNRLWGNNENNK